MNDLKDRFCSFPFKMFEVAREPINRVYVCCPSWLPTEVGQLTNQEVGEIWNSSILQKIRASIHDGSFKYCNHNHCPHIQAGTLPKRDEVSEPYLKEIIEKKKTALEEGPKILNLASDRSCNLSCPSCRTEKIMKTAGKEFEILSEAHAKILNPEFLKSVERILICGSGDPFASRIYREFLLNLDGHEFPDLKISLTTNGQLLTPEMWGKLHRLHGNIDRIYVSFDAATAETYGKVRRGGELEPLIENVQFLAKEFMKKPYNDLRCDFVVQSLNFREMPAFVRLVKTFEKARVFFQRIVDWETYSKEDFPKQTVYRKEHPEHPEFLKVLEDSVFRDPIVDMGNMMEFMPSDYVNEVKGRLVWNT